VIKSKKASLLICKPHLL